MRTPEEKTADETLDTAIRTVMDAYAHTGLVVGYVLSVAIVEYEDDGQHSGLCRYVPEDQHWIQTLGICEASRAQMQNAYITGLGEDD